MPDVVAGRRAGAASAAAVDELALAADDRHVEVDQVAVLRLAAAHAVRRVAGAARASAADDDGTKVSG